MSVLLIGKENKSSKNKKVYLALYHLIARKVVV
ncbi:uncharacterized protein METZ01_LOCUS339165 [marine metagenome]|uniref:Uncharacterized protein n=1 Tax=marine metagenome TaxID=408172 RepID=A0A382QPQ3_9ZZZZ